MDTTATPTPEVVKVLVIDTGKEPIKTERFDLAASDPAAIRKTILTVMNRMGKNSHALIHFRKKWFVADHTAQRGPSEEYAKTEVRYHPMMEQLS